MPTDDNLFSMKLKHNLRSYSAHELMDEFERSKAMFRAVYNYQKMIIDIFELKAKDIVDSERRKLLSGMVERDDKQEESK